MVGTILNAAGIIVGAAAGLLRQRPLSSSTESLGKVLLGAFTVFYGLKLTWTSLNGSVLQILKQILIAMLALGLGRWTGSLLGLQRRSNELGQKARVGLDAAASGTTVDVGQAFRICAVLFCAAPLGIIGAVLEGTSDYPYPLAIKGVMDGLAAMGLARAFGGGLMLSAVPVLALQGTISLGCATWVAPLLREQGLIDAVNGTAGLLVFSVALVILQLKRLALADYLPSLLWAPVITWLWR